MKMAVFWDIAPCSLVDTDRRFRGAYCLHYHSDRPEFSNAMKMSFGFKGLTRLSYKFPTFLSIHSLLSLSLPYSTVITSVQFD
jgi:hypothetical protein